MSRASPARIQAAAHDEGLVCRALGSAIAIAPPLVATEQDIAEIGEKLLAALDRVAEELGLM